MQIEILTRPGAATARLQLMSAEHVTCEIGAMLAMSSDLRVTTRAYSRNAGLLKGLRRMLAGENFFLNTFTAIADGQELWLAPKLIGDIATHRLNGGTLLIQGSSWLAMSGAIDLDLGWQGLAGAVFSGEPMFWVKCSGTGDLLFNTYGGIYEVDIRDSYTVDTGHIVAFENTLRFRIGKAADSWLDSFFAGEGLVCKFSGVGKLWCQTHNPHRMGRLVGPRLKPREK